MKKFFISTILVMAMGQYGPCQNLIKNSSFEERFACPNNAPPVGNHRLQNNLFNWAGTLSAAGYFNSCAYIEGQTYQENDIPHNFAGTQYARTGEGYVGSYIFGIDQRGQLPWPEFNYCTDYYQRGFFWQELENSLIAGKKYYTEVYVSLGENSAYQRNTLGIKLSLDSPNVDNQEYLAENFQLMNDTVNLNDQVNWQHLQWIFEADSAYSYLTYGPGKTCIDENDTVFIDYVNFIGGLSLSTLYYFDDVGLYQIQGSSSTQTFCGNTATLSTPIGSFNHIWSNGGRSASTTISGSGTYTVFYRIDSLAISDTINVEFMPTIAENFLGPDTVLLVPQSTISLSGPSGYSYSWNTGSTVRTLDVTAPGTYWLTVTDQNGCMTTDTVVVVFDTSVGINNFWKNTDIQIYPNPAKEILYIKLPDLEKNSKFNFEICNSQGQVVLSLQNKVAIDKIELNNLSDGIYLLKIVNNSTYEIFTHSFVVKR